MDALANFGVTAEERDIRHHLHACTNARRHMDVGPMIIEEGSGIHGHKSHGPAIDFAERLIDIALLPMSKVSFTHSGSEANDTVLKMVSYRSNALGLPEKKKVIVRIRGYHGVTIVSASLTGLPYNHRSFDLPLERVLHTGFLHYWRDGQPGETEGVLEPLRRGT